MVEYPRTLFTRRKWQERRENLKCGDIVSISDASAARGDWPLGILVSTYPDNTWRGEDSRYEIQIGSITQTRDEVVCYDKV